MFNVPKSGRKHIVFTGRRNVGKSSLMNIFSGQDLSIVSNIAGTTTDPVKKAMELLPYGPVVLVDTAGIDDKGELGEKRISRTFKAIAAADFVILVIDATGPLHEDEKELIFHLESISVPYVIAANKIENGISKELLSSLKKLKKQHYEISCKENAGIDELKRKIMKLLPAESDLDLLNEIIVSGDTVVLVVPVDSGAPKGRLILPQVQTIRNILDLNATAVVVKENDLISSLKNLKTKPALVITDSQAIKQVASEVPEEINLTTFSILMARSKGDLKTFLQGVKKIEELKDQDKVLIAEACTHHSQFDDIGRVKIPKWLKEYTKKQLIFDTVSGEDFPEDLDTYSLVVHCGGCMFTRHFMQTRIRECRLMNVPVVNYGVLISYIHGAYPRVIRPFKEAVSELKERKQFHF